MPSVCVLPISSLMALAFMPDSTRYSRDQCWGLPETPGLPAWCPVLKFLVVVPAILVWPEKKDL